MKWLVPTVALMLAGCSGSQPSAGGDAGTKARPSTGATVASAPREIQELSNQTLVYECPKCGMMFDAAGTCTMDGSTLVATQVAYLCPADSKPVEHAGQCPRCAVNARVVKTAMAQGSAPDKQ